MSTAIPDGNGRLSLRRMPAVLEARGLGISRIVFGYMDLFGQPDFGEQPDAPEVGIDFVPLQSMARGHRVRVMVVVPSFAARQQRNPPAVARVVASLKAPASPKVRGRVHQPGGMEAERDAERHTP